MVQGLFIWIFAAMKRVVVPSFYLAPVGHYAAMRGADEVVVDVGEHFVKQTARNRCLIEGSGERQKLIIPVEHGDLSHRAMKDVRISDHSPWQRQHAHALKTYYSGSPFFEFYWPDMEPLYERRWEWLVDWNEALDELLRRWLFVDAVVEKTDEYTGQARCREGLSVVHLLFNYGNEAMLRLKDYED